MVLRIYRIARWCYLHHLPLIPSFLKGGLFLIFKCVIPPECVIGKGTRLWHHGLGVMIHPDVEIGENCNIYNFAAIGGGYDGPDGPAIRILIGDRVNIGHGALIMCKGGTLRVGNDSTVGVHSLVVSDVPPNVMAVGYPARCIPKQDWIAGLASPVGAARFERKVAG